MPNNNYKNVIPIFDIDKLRFTSNSKNVVTECSPGYSGIGCSITCPPPLFGEHCQNICDCSSIEYCDFILGCLKSKFIYVCAY